MSALTQEDIERIVDQRLKALFEYMLKGFQPVGAGVASSVKPSQTATTTPNPPAPTNHILSGLPKEIADLLSAEKGAENWVIHAEGYLKPDWFKQACQYFKSKGGDYTHATNGQHGYWTAPIKESQP